MLNKSEPKSGTSLPETLPCFFECAKLQKVIKSKRGGQIECDGRDDGEWEVVAREVAVVDAGGGGERWQRARGWVDCC